MTTLPSYSIAIRTIGKAGEIYQNLLNSILTQTHKPEKIMVYLAEGYDRPKETIGIEEIVIGPVGMTAKRALQYNEIDSEYILLLDDDVLLAPDSAEKMIKNLMHFGGEFCVADTWHIYNRSFKRQLRVFFSQLAYTRKDDGWGVKVCRNGSFSYNNKPSTTIVKTQSGAGCASIWRKQSFLNIHFEDEVWLDKFKYSFIEDQLMFYKVIANGSYGLLCYDSGIDHMDARTGRSILDIDSQKVLFRSQMRFLLWYRTIYECSNSICEKMLNYLSYFALITVMSISYIALSILKLSPKPIAQFIRGQVLARRYVKSEEYRTIPKYKLYK